MVVKVKLYGVRNVLRYLSIKEAAVNKGIDEGSIQAANLLKEEVKASIRGQRAEPKSILSGKFIDSVELATQKNAVVVFSDVEYAKFIEFGTRKINPRSHFKNSADRNKNKITKIMKNSVGKKL